MIQDGLSRATYPALVSGHQNRNDAKGAISTNMPGYTPAIVELKIPRTAISLARSAFASRNRGAGKSGGARDEIGLWTADPGARCDLAMAALGIIISTAALVILWAEAFWRL